MRSALRFRNSINGALSRARPLLRRLPSRHPLVVEPPKSNNWDVVEGRSIGGMGMAAARSKEGQLNDRGFLRVKRKVIDAAIECAPLAADLLVLQTICKKVKTEVVSYQSETKNPARTNALLSAKSLARALACVGLCSGSCQFSRAAHAFALEITRLMNEDCDITATRATQAAMSLTLRYAEELHADGHLSKEQMEAMLMVREVLGVQAQCSYAEKNATYHDWLVELEDLDAFWERMERGSYRDQIVDCLGKTLMRHQDGAIKLLMLSKPDWDGLGGETVRDSASFLYFELAHVNGIENRLLSPRRHRRSSVAQMIISTVCYASYPEITMYGAARLAVSDLHAFFTYNQAMHCGLDVKKPTDVDETHFLLDFAKRLKANVKTQFGIWGHSMTAWSAKLTFVPLLGECEQWGPLRDARVGVWRTLPLHDSAVYGRVYDILTSGRPVLGDHGIPKKLYSGDGDWVPGPGL